MLSSPLYRLGRKLYTNARLEISQNDIATNGEASLQKQIIDLFATKTITVFDVGANVGDWSIKLIEQAGTCQLAIHAFEPVTETNAVFKRNSQSHIRTSTTLTINQLALSNIVGEKTIHLSGHLAGSNSLHETPEVDNSELINLTTLDQYCEDCHINHIHLVKIDTEGHDMFAIEGAKQFLIEEKISVLQFEYNHRWIFSRRYLKDVFDFRDSFLPAYQIGKLTGAGIIVYPVWHYELEKFFEGNYLLIHKSMEEKLNCKPVNFDHYNALS